MIAKHIYILVVAIALALGLPGANARAPKSTWWTPTPPYTFNYLLGTKFNIKTHYQAGIKVYFLDGEDTPAGVVAALKARGASPVCYFSAGSYEDWRSDAAAFPAAALGKKLDGWAGERWLDVRAPALRPIMLARMQRCADKGFVAVDPDNVDGYTNDSGFPLAAADQLAYNRWLASAAHSLGLAAGLKNDVGQVAALAGDFDFFVNEQCYQYNECGSYAPAKAAGKPVFNIEYRSAAFARGCACGDEDGLQVIQKRLKLDAWLRTCSAAQRAKPCAAG